MARTDQPWTDNVLCTVNEWINDNLGYCGEAEMIYGNGTFLVSSWR